jgi:hypothetical protein
MKMGGETEEGRARIKAEHRQARKVQGTEGIPGAETTVVQDHEKPSHRGGGGSGGSVKTTPFHESLSEIEMSSRLEPRKPRRQARSETPL